MALFILKILKMPLIYLYFCVIKKEDDGNDKVKL